MAKICMQSSQSILHPLGNLALFRIKGDVARAWLMSSQFFLRLQGRRSLLFIWLVQGSASGKALAEGSKVVSGASP
jgi:hypothetical protein